MKAIKSYIDNVEKVISWATIGTRDFLETKQFVKTREFLIPLIKDLEIGSEMPEELKSLLGNDGGILDLSLIKRNEILPLKLIFSRNKLINVSTTQRINDPRNYFDLISGAGSDIYSNKKVNLEELID